MKKSDRDILSSFLGCEPIKIDSAIVAPAMRKRYYWTNLKYTPLQKKDISFNDILEKGYSEKKKSRALLAGGTLLYYQDTIKRFRRYYDKRFGQLVFESKKNYEQCCSLYEKYKGMSANKFKEAVKEDSALMEVCNLTRLPTKRELEDCMTVPKGYTNMCTYEEAANLLGDGWTIDVICAFFQNIKES